MLIRKAGEVIVLTPQDTELGADVAEAFKQEALVAIPPEGGQVAVDLGTIQFMDSSGLSALVAVMKRTRLGGGMALFGVRPAVHELFRLTRLDGVFTLCANEGEAISFLDRKAEGEGLKRTA